MKKSKPVIALIFPANSHYSRELTDGVIDDHFLHNEWTLIELPRYLIGDSPLPLKKYRLDGAIVWAEPRDQYVSELIDRGIPIINCGMEWRDQPQVMRVHMIREDLHTLAIQHFRSIGLRRVVAFGHRLEQRPATLDFLKCFVTLAQQAGLDATIWDIGGQDSPSINPRRLLEYQDETEMAAFLRDLPKPSGIFCCGDHMGYLVCAVAKQAGLSIPEDLAIIGFGGNTASILSDPPLSSVLGPGRDIGRIAAEQLRLWLKKGKRPQATILVPGGRLIERESSVGKSGQALMEKMRRFIQEHAVNGISLQELAQAAHLSVKTFVRQYETAFGIHPLAEAQKLRIDTAKQLLASHECTVAEVATRCGFSSQAAFYNYFKRHDGSSPSDWHKTH